MAIDGTGFIEKAVYARDTISDRYICITKCSPGRRVHDTILRKVPGDSLSPGRIWIFRDVLSRASLFRLPAHPIYGIYLCTYRPHPLQAN